MSHDSFGDFVRCGVAIDDSDERFVLEGEENFAAACETGALLEFVGCVSADAYAGDGRIDIEIQDQEEIWYRCKGFVLFADFLWIESTDALVGHGGEVVAIEDNGVAGGESWSDFFCDVLLAVFKEGLEFFLWREATGLGGISEEGAPWTIGGLAGGDDGFSLGFQMCGESFYLGGFSGAIDAFNYYEHGIS